MPKLSLHLLVVCCPWLVLWACADDAAEGALADAGAQVDAKLGDAAAQPPEAPLYGAFTIKLEPPKPADGDTPAAAGLTSVIGKVNDGPTPDTLAWDMVEDAAGCQLSIPRVPLCTPKCGSSAACVEDGVCTPYPKAQDLGPVTLTGFGDEPLHMKAIVGNYQPPAGTKLPYPPCAEGDEITLSIDDGSFSLSARCIAPLTLQGAVQLEPGEPLRLAWSLPSTRELARIHVSLDISHHGGTKGVIECDVPDTGALEIPATLVDRLLELGVSGFPSIEVQRIAQGFGAATVEDVSLSMSSRVKQTVDIAGLQSCTESDQCPEGQSCQADLRCE